MRAVFCLGWILGITKNRYFSLTKVCSLFFFNFLFSETWIYHICRTQCKSYDFLNDSLWKEVPNIFKFYDKIVRDNHGREKMENEL